MGWLALLKALLQLSNMVLAYVQQRQLLKAGEASAIGKQISASLDALGKAERARDSALKRFDDTGGVPDDKDPNLRD